MLTNAAVAKFKALSFRKKAFCLSVGFCAALLCAFHFMPLPEGIEQRPYSKILLSYEGELLAARIAKDQQWRFPKARQLPEKYITALLAFEDRDFYMHPGVNPLAIARATISNVKAGHVVSGGSTLTMQLARMLRHDPPRTYANKLYEMLLALKLEWHYSKHDILLMYASEAPFGGNTVGLGAASWRYFSRYLEPMDNPQQALQLSWAEAAFLAVLPNSPALVHPGRSRDVLKAKRDRLLQFLFSEGALSKQELQLSILEPLPEKPQALPQTATHLLDTLIQQTPEKFRFYSSINAQLQRKVLAAATLQGQALAREGVHNLAIVVIDHRDMSVPVYIGNITSGAHPELYGNSMDLTRRPRSTGSVLKPLLYAMMLQEGELLPNTLIPDVPTDYRGFTPENYDHQYRGAVPAHEALARSLNIPAVRMLQQYGNRRFYDDLKNMGMSTLFRPSDDYGLSLILGGAEGQLWELTQIYAKLMRSARMGPALWQSNEVSLLREITPQTASNKNAAASQRAFTIGQGAAWLTLDALLHVTRPGTEGLWESFSSSQKVAWKTGTSYGLRDAWAIGSNAHYTVGVWAGNASGEGVAGLSGLNTAAPSLFKTFDLLGNSQWIEKPSLALKALNTCIDDGYLAAGKCKSEISEAPIESHFQKVTPFHKRIQVDRTGQYRVHGGCETVANMQTQQRLILPPIQEYYWKQHHSQFNALPPWREDCIADLANYTDDLPMDIIYPLAGSKVYIPNELDGQKGRVVFRASHRNRDARLFWHVDNNFIRQTETFHDIAVNLAPGWHKLILVDELGFRLERWFKVLGQS